MKKVISILLVFILIASAMGCDPSSPKRESDDASSPAAFRLSQDARISYLGPEGTYTEEAAQFFFPKPAALLPEATVLDAISDLARGTADYAVIPQENTLGGAVTNYVDALIAQKDLFVVGEIILPISQTLMGLPGASLEDIRLVCSHTQGLTQSETWRKQYLPNAEIREMDSTAAAAKYVSEAGDPAVAAVAAPGAAKLYGLSVLAEDVQITDTNKTRFYVLSASGTDAKHGTHAVFVADCAANQIDDIIVEIHDAGLELVTIHDRPAGSRLGAYRYLIEVEYSSGLTDTLLKPLEAIPELRCLGFFYVMEKGRDST